jgi:CheY-like chemotaxis protein
MESGGAITVRADNLAMGQEAPEPLSPGPYVRISVADTGIGIPQENLSRVFDPYFTTKPTGSGLGLAVSHAIVRRHGGDITLSSLPGRGTVVSVLVPASPGATVDAALVRPRSPVGKGRVLVMDDLPELRQLYRNALTTLGYEPEAASDGEEAVRLYREALAGGRPFACVIMDLTVPGGTGGTAALAELQRIDPHVRAIVASGYSNDPVLADFRAAGFAGRLAKPFTFSEMGRVVEEVLGRRGDG